MEELARTEHRRRSVAVSDVGRPRRHCSGAAPVLGGGLWWLNIAQADPGPVARKGSQQPHGRCRRRNASERRGELAREAEKLPEGVSRRRRSEAGFRRSCCSRRHCSSSINPTRQASCSTNTIPMKRLLKIWSEPRRSPFARGSSACRRADRKKRSRVMITARSRCGRRSRSGTTSATMKTFLRHSRSCGPSFPRTRGPCWRRRSFTKIGGDWDHVIDACREFLRLQPEGADEVRLILLDAPFDARQCRRGHAQIETLKARRPNSCWRCQCLRRVYYTSREKRRGTDSH